MRIVIRHDEAGQWWWTVLGERGGTAAISRALLEPVGVHAVRGRAQGRGPAATVTYEEPYAANPGTWTISSLMPSGS